MRPIFLIGARASGKTTIGKKLANLLEYNFLDLDQSLCASLDCSIEEIVAKDGWQSFRNLESEHLANICNNIQNDPRTIIATGGGIILRSENRIVLNNNGIVIWLKAEPEELHKRMIADPLSSQRPSLTDKDLLTEINQTLRDREHLYSQCADHIINVSTNMDTICSQIIDCILPK